MTAAQPIIGSGLVTTARTLVIIAVTKSTSRSSNSGNDTTVSEKQDQRQRGADRIADGEEQQPLIGGEHDRDELLQAGERGVEPSSSAISSRTWYIQITKTNSVTKAIQPISLRERTVLQMAPSEIG